MSSVALSVRSSEFGALVRQRAWDWLSALQRRLGVDRLQIVDESGSALLPDVSVFDWPETSALFTQALQSRAPESARIGDLQVTCVGLVAGDRKRGALLLARQISDATAAEVRAELEVIGSWLRPAIEAHLGSSAAEAAEQAPRVSALFRVLSGAATAGSEPALLRLYANALAIWHDIELRAYLEDVDGNLRLAITLPGASGELPARLDGDQVSIGAELTRVSGHDLEVLGFPAGDEAVAARVGDLKQGTVWLLVLSGAIDASTEARLTLYTDVLRQVLQNVAAASLLDVERTIWQALVSGDDVQAAAERGLGEVTGSFGVSTGALTVTAADGAPGLRLGELALFADQAAVRSDRLIATTGTAGYPTIALAIQGAADRVFSSREREVLNRLAQLIASWAGGIWPRSLDAPDRRSIARSFEDVLEESAGQAAARGTGSSVVVIRLTDASTRQIQAMAADLRAHVRAGESVGVLGTGEIGLLLYDNTPDVALSVVNRLRHAVTGPEAVELFARAAVGMVHVSAGDLPAPGLVARARERAPGSVRSSKRRANS